MSTDTDGDEEPTVVKIDVKVTDQQKEVIDEAWKERGYPSRSEFIRDVLRDATEPVLTSEALRELAEGMADAEEGRTVSLEAAKEDLGIDSGFHCPILIE